MTGTSVSGSVRRSAVTAARSCGSATAHVGIDARVHAIPKVRRLGSSAGGAVVVAKTGAGASARHSGGARHAGSATDRWASAEGAANCSWLTLETVVTLLTAGQAATLLLEVCHADGRESGGGVVLRLILVDLVDGDGRVDNGRLDGLLLDDWLDGPDHVSITATGPMALATHS